MDVRAENQNFQTSLNIWSVFLRRSKNNERMPQTHILLKIDERMAILEIESLAVSNLYNIRRGSSSGLRLMRLCAAFLACRREAYKPVHVS